MISRIVKVIISTIIASRYPVIRNPMLASRPIHGARNIVMNKHVRGVKLTALKSTAVTSRNTKTVI